MDFHKIFLFFHRVLNGVYTPIRINYQARVLMGSVASVDIQRKVTKYHNLPMNHSCKNVHRESSKQLRNILLQDVFHIFFLLNLQMLSGQKPTQLLFIYAKRQCSVKCDISHIHIHIQGNHM